jgi:heme exporter protein D
MSIGEFFAMGGFGYYVWMSMGMALVLMLGEVFFLKNQRKNLLKQVQRMIRMEKNRT